MKKIILSQMILLTLLMSGCSDCIQFVINHSSMQDQCIPPLVKQTYQVNLDFSKEPIIILPQYPWQQVSSLPEINREEGQYYNTSLFIPPNSDSLWVERDYIAKATNKEVRELWLYFPKQNHWNEIPGAFSIFSASRYLELVHSSKNIVWAMGYSSAQTLEEPNLIIGKYNNLNEKFEEFAFDTLIPEGDLIFDENKNIFWDIVSKTGTIFKLDIQTGKITTFFQSNALKDYYSSPVLSHDGSIFMLFMQGINNPYLIYKFNPDAKTLENIKNPIKNDDHFDSLFIDQANNLWLNDHSKMDNEGKWYQIIRSHIFITDRMREENNQYVWLYPKFDFESSNGYLWFTSYNGPGWYDSESEKWCWVTTEKSYIYPGNNHEVWMVTDDKLYHYDLPKKQ